MDPIYRTRENISRFPTEPRTNFMMREYNSANQAIYDRPLSNWWSGNLFSAQYIKDEIHSIRRSGYGRGRYPPGYCFNQYADLSGVVPMVDVQELWGGQLYSNRWDSGPKPLLYPPDGQNPNRGFTYMLGATSAMPEGWVFRVPSSIVNLLSEEAWNYFSDVLPANLSFGEFVQGFTQLKDLLPSVEESVTKTISGGYLKKKFGWDNLLSDLDTLSNLFSIVTERMEFFKRTYGIPTRLGFSRHIDWTPHCTGVYPNAYSGDPFPVRYAINGVTDMVVWLKDFRATFRATAWIMQHLDFCQDLIGFLRVLAGALGLNNPVKLFWETLPLSFVVDWFFNISTHLDNLTRLNPAMGWDCFDMTQSVTYEYTYEITQRATYDPRGANYAVQTWSLPVRVYERQNHLSFAWELLNPNELSPTQLTLLLAMLHQLG